MSTGGLRALVICAFVALVFWVVAFVAIAQADDGIDPTPKPQGCVNYTISGGNNWTAPLENGKECVEGGSGNNAISTRGNLDYIDGNGGSDSLYGGDDQDVLYGGQEGDYIEGNAGDDVVYAGCPGGCNVSGRAHFDALYGGSGDDRLAMRNNEPNDEAHCGTGNDVVYLDSKSITDGAGHYDTADGSCEDVRRG